MKNVFLLLIIFACFALFQAFSSNTTDQVINSGSLSEILNEDGTINMDAPSGSYSAIGFKLVSGDDEEPTFLKAEGSDAGWSDPFTYNGLGSTVRAVCKIGTKVYCGGSFTNAGGKEDADYIAYWNGYSWYSLGSTPLNNTVYALATDGTYLYVGGSFYDAGGITTADKIAKWSGSSWSAMGTGANSTVYAITVDGTDVYIGGYFTSVSGVSNTNKIAKWDGSSWSAVGSPSFSSSDYIYDLDIGGGFLWIGGNFDSYGGNVTGCLLSTYNYYPAGVGVGNGIVNAVKWSGSTYEVYAGGTFTDAGNITAADRIALCHYKNGAIAALGTGLNAEVRDIEIINGDVYVTGDFTDAGGDTYADRLAIWDGSSWDRHSNDGYPTSDVYCMFYDDANSEFYIGGAFSALAGEYIRRIAMHDGTKWYNMASSVSGIIYDVVVDNDGDVFIAGNFFNAGGIPEADRMAYYDVSASQWKACETGLGSTAFCLATDGTTIWVGGAFENAGGNSNADYVASYNKSTNTFSALTSTPLNGSVSALDYHSSLLYFGTPPTYAKRLYIGGSFTAAGGVSNANYLCLWVPGTTVFDRVGTSSTPSLNGSVYSLDAFGGRFAISTHTVIIGGAFSDAYGDTYADRLAQIATDGSHSAIGNTSFYPYYVYAIKYVNSSNIYIGGSFSNIGDSYGDKIVKWNGTSWESLGTGLSSTVYSIEVVGNNVYTGGYFTDAGGDQDGDYIAYWDGKDWIPMGSGMGVITNDEVRSIAYDDNYIYAVGDFMSAGSKQYEYLARYGTIPEITDYDPTSDQEICEGGSITMEVTASGNPSSYTWYKNGTVVSSSSSYTISSLSPSHEGTYECKVSNTYGHTYSRSFDLTVYESPSITTQPTTDGTCEDVGQAYFAVGATGYSLNYQWYRRTSYYGTRTLINSSTDGGIYNGYTTDELEVDGPSLSMDNYYYECLITNQCDTNGIFTTRARLDVYQETEIYAHPSNDSICPGDDGYFICETYGYNNQYQWQVSTDGGTSWSDINNGTYYGGAQYTELEIFSPPSSFNGYQYKCIIDGECGSVVTSNPATLTIYDEVDIIAQYNNVYACENSTAKFGIQATGTGLDYNWYIYNSGSWQQLSDGGAYSGTDTDTLEIAASDDLNGKLYRAQVIGKCGYEWANYKSLTVNQAPEITNQPSAKEACEGETTTFSLTANGYGTLSYQWAYSVDNINWTNTGINDSTLNTSSTEDRYIRCIVSGECSPPVTSDITTLTIKANPSVTDQPDDVTECEGGSPTFTIAASNATGYQWQRSIDNGNNWTNMTGATGISITLSNVSSSMNGYQYRCSALGECDNDISSAAILTVIEAPEITVEPENDTVCEGNDAVFSVTATNAGSYQWQYYIVGDDWYDYSGETLSTFTRTGVMPVEDGVEIRCIAYSGNGCLPNDTSEIAQIIIRDEINITIEPDTSKGIATNSNGTIEFEATGYDLTYQWQRIDDGKTGSWESVPENTHFSNTDSSSLIITDAQTTMGDSLYRCYITDGCGLNDSTVEVVLSVDDYAEITQHPSNASVCPSTNHTFTITATGASAYQWQEDDGNGFSNISGANSSSYEVTSIDASMDGYLYRCVVLGGGSGLAISSNYAKLTVKESVSIVTQPSSLETACEGDDVTYEIVASGTGLHYAWTQYEPGSPPTTSPVGSDSPILTLSSVTESQNTYYYTCQVSGECGTPVTSDYSVLNVNTTPEIDAQPTNKQVCEGGSTSFTVTVLDIVDYQWQIFDGGVWTNIINSTVYSGSETNTLTINNAIIDLNNAQFRCEVTNDCGVTTSNSVTLTVYELPNITSQPVDAEICEGSDTLFGIVASGYNITAYLWEYSTDDGSTWSEVTNAGIYSDATTDTLILTGATSAVNGYLYRCTVSGECDPDAVSNEVQLTINTAPSITQQPADKSVCEGKSTYFKTEASGSISGYQWYENDGGGWSALLNMDYYNEVTTDSLSISGVDITLEGYQYYCEVIGVCGNLNTNTITLSINKSPEITVEPVNLTICEGVDTSLTIDATGDNISYNWEINKGTSWETATDSAGYIDVDINSLHLLNVDYSLNGIKFRCIVSGDCEPVDSSNEVEITVNLLPVITYLDEDTALCEGNSITIKGLATSEQTPSYSWKLNNVIINDETDTLITLNNLLSSDGGEYLFEATNSCGTSDSALTITVHDKPVVNLGSDQIVCYGEVIILDAGTASTYLWNNDSTSSTLEVTENGLYSVTVTNTHNCENSDSVNLSFIHPYNEQELAYTTVNSDGDVEIVWDYPEDDSIVSFVIYKEESINEYTAIDTIPFDSLNMYIDEDVNTDFYKYKYAISIIDTCGNESDMSITQNTIKLLISKASGNHNKLEWNTYNGFDYDRYFILYGTNPNSLSILDEISAEEEKSYIDAEVRAGDTYYQIMVKNSDTTIVDDNGDTSYYYSSKSNYAKFAKPVAEFSANKTEILIGDSIQFTDESENNPTTWKWTFESGNADDRAFQNPLVKYNIAGLFNVSLMAKNSYGDSTLVKEEYVKVVGIENASTALCYGESVTLKVNDADYTYTWSTGATTQEITITPEETDWYYVTITNGGSNVVDSVNIQVSPAPELGDDKSLCKGDTTVLIPGEYISYNWNSGESTDSILAVFNTDTIDLIVEDDIGCTFEDSVIVTVHSLPQINLGEDVTVCYGIPVNLDAGGTGLTYSWSTSDTTQLITVDTTGEYAVTATNVYDCSSADTVYVLTKVPYAFQEIFMVTVDTSEDKNMILWDKAINEGIDSFKIYKETIVANEYKLIGTKSHKQYNYYIDENSDPKVQSAKYKISVVDTCGNESALSDHHKTIHLTSNIGISEGDTVMNLIWNHYDGFIFGTYNIYRGSSENSLTLIGQKAADF